MSFTFTNKKGQNNKEIGGRGTIKIPESCKLLSNKVIFSDPRPSNVFLLSNHSTGPEISIRDTISYNRKQKENDATIRSGQFKKLKLLDIPSIPSVGSKNIIGYLEAGIGKVAKWQALIILLSGLWFECISS